LSPDKIALCAATRGARRTSQAAEKKTTNMAEEDCSQLNAKVYKNV